MMVQSRLIGVLLRGILALIGRSCKWENKMHFMDRIFGHGCDASNIIGEVPSFLTWVCSFVH